MYSSLSLYYLKHLGIRPWVSRELTTAKVIILVNSEYAPKEQLLLSRMIQYLNIQEREYLIININSNASFEKLMRQDSIITILGLIKPEELSSKISLDRTVFFSYDPQYVLKNPGVKKQVLQVLNEMNKIIDDSSLSKN